MERKLAITRVGHGQQPADAQSVLRAWPTYAESDLDNVRGSREALLFWQQAKASGEFSAAYAASLTRQVADPVADALMIDWGCWRPERHDAALEQANAWISSYAELIDEADAGWVAYVQARHSWLEEQLAVRDSVLAASSLAGIMTMLAIVVALGLSWVGLRLAQSASAGS